MKENINTYFNFKQIQLKDLLLSGKLNPTVFLNIVFKLDQQGNHLEQCDENLRLLEDKKVKSLLLSNGQSKEYYNLLSLSYVHMAQKYWGNITYFEKALEAAMHNAMYKDYLWWIYYIKGNIAFLQRDESGLKKSIKFSKGKNKEILQHMLEYLQKGLDPKGYMQHISKS